MMTSVNRTLLNHKIVYALELAYIHSEWMAKWLYDDDHKSAFEGYQRWRKVVESVFREMDNIGVDLEEREAFGEAAKEYRADRERSAKVRPTPQQKPSEAA